MAAATEELCGTCWLTAGPTHSEGILPLVRAQLHCTHGSATRLTSSSSSSHLGYWRWLSCLLLLLFLEHRVESGLKCKEKIYCSCARGKKVSVLSATCWMSRNLCSNGERHLLNTRQNFFSVHVFFCNWLNVIRNVYTLAVLLWIVETLITHFGCIIWLWSLLRSTGKRRQKWIFEQWQWGSEVSLPSRNALRRSYPWSTKLCQKETSF